MTAQSEYRLGQAVAIVSGGARGLGEAQVRILAANGARVICADILDREGALLACELSDAVRYERLDVRIHGEWDRLVERTEARWGPVSILVNNAGVLPLDRLESFAEETFRNAIDINLMGTLFGMQAVLPSMRRAGGGSIVNISSTAGLGAAPYLAAYSASKFAIRGLTKVAALEFASDNVRVNSVHPGNIRTEMTKEFPDAVNTPIERWGLPEEVAQAVLFLCSKSSSFVTGAEFVIDGGQSAVLAGTT